jgi:hypothetical protein
LTTGSRASLSSSSRSLPMSARAPVPSPRTATGVPRLGLGRAVAAPPSVAAGYAASYGFRSARRHRQLAPSAVYQVRPATSRQVGPTPRVPLSSLGRTRRWLEAGSALDERARVFFGIECIRFMLAQAPHRRVPRSTSGINA